MHQAASADAGALVSVRLDSLIPFLLPRRLAGTFPLALSYHLGTSTAAALGVDGVECVGFDDVACCAVIDRELWTAGNCSPACVSHTEPIPSPGRQSPAERWASCWKTAKSGDTTTAFGRMPARFHLRRPSTSGRSLEAR